MAGELRFPDPKDYRTIPWFYTAEDFQMAANPEVTCPRPIASIMPMFSRISCLVGAFAIGICAFAQIPPSPSSADEAQVDQVIQNFEQLSLFDQSVWLGQRWRQVSDMRWLPVLQKLALRDIDFRQPGNPELTPAVQLSKLALKRWYELDPQTGREAILREITSPTPRFGADALGILPDQVLPVEQHIIAEHFASISPPPPTIPTRADLRPGTTRHAAYASYKAAETHLASLLFRYASPDVLSEVLPAIQQRVEQRNCNAQYNEIAFLLKVKPEEASSLLHGMVSDRRPGYTGCVISMYSQVERLITSPVLERFAIESLDDSDLAVAAEGLRYLRDHGSARAEQPIFERFIRWNEKWRDHLPDLDGTSGQPNPNYRERSFGRELAQALAIGHGWLADEARIRQLLALSIEPDANSELTAILKQLEKKPIPIYFMGKSSSRFLVAQYQLESVDDLKNKLAQYPRGTTFVWNDRRSAAYETLDRQTSSDIAQWSAANGIHIEGL